MQNIDVDLTSLPENVLEFVQSVLKTCEENNIPVKMPNAKTVQYAVDGVSCAGFFDDDPVQFGTACKGSYKKWLPVFVHESCHMDQWLEKSPFWTNKIPGHDVNPTVIFDKWITNKLEIDDATRDAIIDYLVYLELDCERRSVEKIKKYNLPVDLDVYIRKSNAYAWSYRLVGETRNWDHSASYSITEVWEAMPGHFDNDYSIIPDYIRSIMLEHADECDRVNPAEDAA